MNTTRNEALANAPMSVAPRASLTTAREIRKAVERNQQGGNYGVYCALPDGVHRVTDARTRRQVLEVKTFSGWVQALSVYVEG